MRAHARELERRGAVVTVVAPEPGGAFGWPGATARMRERPLRALEAARWIVSARARVKGLEVDRIVAHWAVPCAWPIATGTRVPIYIVSHGGDIRLPEPSASPRHQLPERWSILQLRSLRRRDRDSMHRRGMARSVHCVSRMIE